MNKDVKMLVKIIIKFFLKCSIRVLKCSIRVLKYSIRVLKCSIRVLNNLMNVSI